MTPMSSSKVIEYTGVLARGLGVLAWNSAVDCEVIVNLVPKDSGLPLRVEREFFTSEDKQTEIPVELFEGEDPDPLLGERLGECTLTGIPSGRAGRPVKVRIEIDLDRTIRLLVIALGKQQEAIIQYNKARVLDAELVQDHAAFIREIEVRGEDD